MAINNDKKSKKKKQPKFTPEERKKRKIKQDHMRSVRSVFRNIGFERATEIAEKDIVCGGQAGEFDDAFIHENLIVLAEYTTSQSSDISPHLKNKKILFSKVLSDTKQFIQYLRKKFPLFDERLGSKFHEDKYILKIVYCSYHQFDEHIKTVVTEPVYIDYPTLKYFEKLSTIIKMSSLHELLAFLNIEPSLVAREGIFPTKQASVTYHGSILPESSSGFPSGYKVVSFYVDAAALLSRSHVLRRDGWRGSFQAYQRMVQQAKIEAIRKKLKSDRQVFVNNLIATLPSDVHPVDASNKTVDISKLTETEAVSISLPLRANSIGLIDGQHRLYSYYESKEDDEDIKALRHQQNLLVTGIIYPEGTPPSTAERFEATLFLAINSNQTNAPTALRQEIEVFLSPFSPTAIGKQVMQGLAKNGPLSGHVENYFFDKGKLKTTSIVSYGLGPLIKLGGEDSIFSIFEHPDKEKISKGDSVEGLDAYLQFSVSKINILLSAVKANVSKDSWTTDPSVTKRLLTVTYVNSFLITMRSLIQNGHELEFESLKESLVGIEDFPFKDFHSSQYGRMAEKIYDKHFAKT